MPEQPAGTVLLDPRREVPPPGPEALIDRYLADTAREAALLVMVGAGVGVPPEGHLLAWPKPACSCRRLLAYQDRLCELAAAGRYAGGTALRVHRAGPDDTEQVAAWRPCPACRGEGDREARRAALPRGRAAPEQEVEP